MWLCDLEKNVALSPSNSIRFDSRNETSVVACASLKMIYCPSGVLRIMNLATKENMFRFMGPGCSSVVNNLVGCHPFVPLFE